MASLTAVSIARAAGIRQPNFYAHFRNIDDCLAAAAEHVVTEFRRVDDAALRELRSAVESGADYREANVRYHRHLLELLVAERHVTELYLRHRLDQSAFSRALQRLHEESLARVRAHLWDWAVRSGVSSRHVEAVSLLAELHVAAVATVTLSLLDGRAHDLDVAAEMLAANAEATIRATFRRLLASDSGS